MMNSLPTRPAHVSPEQWDRAQRDLETYRRVLPRLLQEGHAGKYAIIKDDQIVSIWDTVGEALQAAGERFGLEPVATYQINPLDVERFALVDAQAQAGKEAECPS
jgi:hypothetical protein